MVYSLDGVPGNFGGGTTTSGQIVFTFALNSVKDIARFPGLKARIFGVNKEQKSLIGTVTSGNSNDNVGNEIPIVGKSLANSTSMGVIRESEILLITGSRIALRGAMMTSITFAIFSSKSARDNLSGTPS